MAPQKSKRRARKRRSPGAATRAVPAHRRQQRAERQGVEAPRQWRGGAPMGAYGPRPQSPFGGLPVSEFAIFAGAIALIIGLIGRGGPALIAGAVVCALGVVEVTAREHFSGYRSHSLLLAAFPAVAVETILAVTVGTGRARALLLLIVVPVFAVSFWLLRRRFQVARQARVARRPSA